MMALLEDESVDPRHTKTDRNFFVVILKAGFIGANPTEPSFGMTRQLPSVKTTELQVATRFAFLHCVK